ncbi:HAMP domain-containing sensor histidine kinase [Paenibacillus sp. KACC 21273]|uniref:sensor histidine kinase n=1 Tax=Paenibacillus sp. KACC 21273 TaxID=3025665 RepID=UPI0023666FC8|nr:HAMP domain-containing sensor histidine kinase [Paenibacillus sp. KACC 21273]WDF50036.1 HAMP domain-containing sensor histidine kinase [Paenibacillus sp. KACC 21273]
MKILSKALIGVLIAVIVVVLALSLFSTQSEKRTGHSINYWQIKWQSQNTLTSKPWDSDQDSPWISSEIMKDGKPVNSSSAWIRIPLPELSWNTAGVLIPELNGKHIIVYLDQDKIFESKRSYAYEQNQLLLPLTKQDSYKLLYIWVESAREQISLKQGIMVGDYQDMLISYVSSDLIDVVLGSACIFISLVMVICSVFLRRDQLRMWLSLAAIILSLGILVVTYSPFLFTFYPTYYKLYSVLLDLSLFILLPALLYFFECVFGSGYKGIITKMKKIQYAYSFICVMAMIFNILTNERYFAVYYFISVKTLGILLILQLLILMVVAVTYAFRKNKDAILFASGFSIFALISGGELTWFYIQAGSYSVTLWKWGVMIFVISLISVMARRFAQNHQQMVLYSSRLELFNNELQRSEKMDIISELAASVAHEVRNPLQVTRGFLQLLQMNTDDKGREHLKIALEELDRASAIITDFLTFAKPEFDKVNTLNLAQEFQHIEGIMRPLATLAGGTITMNIPENIDIRGNSSKFKQALINIVKNSIEALPEEGKIHIWAEQNDKEIEIHIQDNGSGMTEEELKRLGEPYFSNKTKGTGPGLMVTFRIIEALGGVLEFKSKKNVGTEAVIHLPAADPQV